MEYIEGYVDHIIFRNEENGYTVLSLNVNGDEEIAVGKMNFIGDGEYIKASGEFVEHNNYGQQFQVQSYDVIVPDDMNGMERYLGSGAIKGVGPSIAAKIVKKFKMDTFRIIEQEGERLSEIKGISEKKARDISVQFVEKQEMRHAMMFLSEYGVSNSLAVKIYEEYGNDMYELIKTNPYQLAEDIAGVGFKIADELANRIGIEEGSDYRIRAGILYTIAQAGTSGHVYLPKILLCQKAAQLLNVLETSIDNNIMDLAIDRKIIIKELNDSEIVYSSQYYYMEIKAARMLNDLNIKYDISDVEIEHAISKIETASSLQLDPLQKEAIIEGARNGFLVLTGGPGTGKTTTINALIKYFETEGLDIMLAAPTGRAAKRMSETTGYKAQTIHRLLELSGDIDEAVKNKFERNEENPLECDVLIVDEVSMLDINLLDSLLKALVPGTRLIIVGDVNQLPSVGPGNVLKDIINSNVFKVVKLTKIFRQEEQSDIVVNAHKINRGERIALDNKSKDFFMLKRNDAKTIAEVTVFLVRDKMPKYVDASVFDIQVLTPMRKGELGVERLNVVLQRFLNPPDKKKKEKEVRDNIFREGDKVMQIKNNYKIEWEVKNTKGFVVENGIGVFNGDMGIIKEINTFSEEVLVIFDDNKEVKYAFSALDELELAYAITIHKAQGSEYPAVVIPILDGPRVLFNRNLLYTAVTRAKKCVTIVGNNNMVDYMIDNVNEQKRYSTLEQRIIEANQV